ncbi:MAG: hypothetical protein IJP26_05140 [Clostridia bacterium]|nr:hypothetical protein [Clostridia bacterium]
MINVYVFFSMTLLWVITLMVSFIIGLNADVKPKHRPQKPNISNQTQQRKLEQEISNFINYNGTPQERIED